MKIGIDARFCPPASAGLGRYLEQLINKLQYLDHSNNYIIFLIPENFDNCKITNSNFKKVKVNVKWYGLAEQILMPYYYWKYKLDLAHIPHFNVPFLMPIPFIITIHDLILVHHNSFSATTLPKWLYKIKYFFYKKNLKRALKKAKKIIALSEFGKKDILENFDIREEKIKVIYNGLTKFNSLKFSEKDDKSFLLRYNIKKPYLLYVGNAYPNKNLELLVSSFLKISDKINIQLVLVGKQDYFYKRLRAYLKENKSNANDKIIFTDYVENKELAKFYKNAKAYIFPSIYEGFGFPPLEAMQFGIPVASSDSSCLPEILGNSALYFNPKSEQEIVEAIKIITINEKLRNKLIKNGYKQIKKYSWKKCAQEVLKIYTNSQLLK